MSWNYGLYIDAGCMGGRPGWALKLNGVVVFFSGKRGGDRTSGERTGQEESGELTSGRMFQTHHHLRHPMNRNHSRYSVLVGQCQILWVFASHDSILHMLK